jgi:hypothetical protein
MRCRLRRCWRPGIRKCRSDDKRLAFLRAVCQVKPRLCVLPRSWLAELRPGLERTGWTRRRSANGQPLTTVEIAPGRLVKCHLGDEAAIKKQFDLTVLADRVFAREHRSLERMTMAIVSSKSFEFVDQQRRMEKGPLVRVDLGGGRMVKMYEADAIAGGHLPGKEQPATGTKSRPPREDKARPPQGDKADNDDNDETRRKWPILPEKLPAWGRRRSGRWRRPGLRPLSNCARPMWNGC